MNARGGCDVCWDLAYVRMRTRGGFQADHYYDLLVENDGDPAHAGSSAHRLTDKEPQ
jgi:hypothetical protein